MARELFVYVDLQGRTHLVGRLWTRTTSRGESASFQYDPQWLRSPVRFSLEPCLRLGQGSFHTPKGKALFGSLGDSAPDRWGRVLMQRRERRLARQEQRAARALLESDYLAMVSDRARQGALRFAEAEGGPFLAVEGDGAIPPLVELGRLLAASERILENREVDQDIQDLVAPGGSLGGARPKASVLDGDGRLLMAKFPSPQDQWDVPLWEYLSLRLAARAGIPTPDARLEAVAGKNVLLLRRFDRKDGWRIPFLSAMSMLGYGDGDQGSYLEIVGALREHGAEASKDITDLWRRMVFNILVSNVDDHLRNHGFLYAGTSGWRLSPVYDLEPTPGHVKPRELHTLIDLENGTASLDLALSVAGEFGLAKDQARTLARRVAEATRDWAREAARLGAGKGEIEFMESAFEHDDLRQALRG